MTAPFASWGHAAAHTLPVQAMTSQLQGAAAAGQTTAVATMATVSLMPSSRQLLQLALPAAGRPVRSISSHTEPMPAALSVTTPPLAAWLLWLCRPPHAHHPPVSSPNNMTTPQAAWAAQVGAAVDSAWSKDDALEQAARAKATSPTQWYVADNLADHTRFFVIQGSETLDHWRVNLTFDPVVFEDEALGVKVHRGVYAAAEALYERFLPLVEEHLASSPYAKIMFTVCTAAAGPLHVWGHAPAQPAVVFKIMCMVCTAAAGPCLLQPLHGWEAVRMPAQPAAVFAATIQPAYRLPFWLPRAIMSKGCMQRWAELPAAR